MAGDVGFDPLGLSNIDNVEIDRYWLREAEIEHCRVTMMAVAGMVGLSFLDPLLDARLPQPNARLMPSGKSGTPIHNTLLLLSSSS
jgi:hypothetical protein